MTVIRWGILGTGKIAKKFADALALLPDARMVAVGSRNRATAESFGMRYNIPHRCDSYDAVADDPDVDIVYVATPHTLHRENTLACIRAGKAVLCEKPFALNAEEAREMVALARQRNVFLMEAMWTRCLPAFTRIRELLNGGVLGEVRLLHADFGFQPEYDPTGRLFDPALGGGALLDLGVYPVSLASLVFGGAPDRIKTAAVFGQTGVDVQSATILEYNSGRHAAFSCSFLVDSPKDADIIGTCGRIRIHRPWWFPDSITIALQNQPPAEERWEYMGNGYPHEAIEAMRCLRGGLPESGLMPLKESIEVMQTLDAIRAQWGFAYPAEGSAAATA